MTFGTSSMGFDPADSAQYAAEAAPVLGGLWLLCLFQFFFRVSRTSYLVVGTQLISGYYSPWDTN